MITAVLLFSPQLAGNWDKYGIHQPVKSAVFYNLTISNLYLFLLFFSSESSVAALHY